MGQKNVLITGASKGIGRKTALLFASKGYHVFINCSATVRELEDLKREIEESGGSCDMVPGNVGIPEDVEKIFGQIYMSCDCLNVLINNAGIAHIGLINDMTNAEWNYIIQTNLSSVFYCSRAAIQPMIARKSGSIINVSSIWGVSGASCEAAYSASKAGVNGLTKALAKELAPSNIQVNAVACGVIDTDMNRQLNERERRKLEEDIPAGRFGTSQEAAEMIWNIANAPSYMTGQIVGLDGGLL